MSKMLLLLTQMDFCSEIHFILILTGRGLFETKRAYHCLEKATLHEGFVTKTVSTLTGKQCVPCSSLSHG
jgi:hypothetical protein